MPTETTPAATASRPLSAAERKQLDQLLAREGASHDPHTPALRTGEPYVALVNLSVPRREKVAPGEVPQSDLVHAGDTVYLTDAEARLYERHDPRDGRRISVVRKVNGPDSSEASQAQAGRIHPSYLSGPVFRPNMPPPGSDQARPDPAGSSRLIETGPVIPESQPPQAGSENYTTSQDAVDILPGGRLANEVRSQADQDVVAAAKAAMAHGERR